MKAKLRQLSVVALLAAGVFGFGKPEHSKVEPKVVHNADQTLTLEFKVVPNSDMKITKEGPWTLTLKGVDGLPLEGAKGGEWTSKAFDEAIPGFTVKTGKISDQGAKGELTYKVRSFICTKDKTRCYPEVHEGKLSWQAKKES